MVREAFLGVDLGTSSIKVILLTKEGEQLAEAQENYNFSVPQLGWAEQEPEDWWQAFSRVIREACALCPKSHRIDAISFSGQMHGLVPLDEEGEVVRPAIIWCDQRSLDEVQDLLRLFDEATWKKWTLNPISTGFLLPSLLWIRNHEAENYKKIRKILLPKDYLRFRLTAKYASDYSDVAGSLAYDVAHVNWVIPLLESLDISLDLFPEVHAATSLAGTVLPNVAKSLGLPINCQVVCGGADQAMQAIGNGLVRAGDASVTVGTGGQVLAVLDKPIVLPKLNAHVFNFYNDKTWFFLAANLSAGLAFRWLRDQVFNGLSFKEMDALADTIEPGSEGLLFLPYLLGERTPHMDPGATAQFSGLRFIHRREHMIRSVLEGVAFALRESFELLPKQVQINRVHLSGGGARSTLWRQIITDVLGRPLVISHQLEQAAVGAALVAAVGVGAYPSLEEATRAMLSPSVQTISPNPNHRLAYERSFEKYKQLYRPMPCN